MAKIIKPGSITKNPTDLLQGSAQDHIEDRSAFLRSEEVVTWTGTELQFTKDIVLEISSAKDGSVKTYTIPVSNSPLAIANGETIYIQIDRTTSGTATLINSSTTPIPAQNTQNKDIFILFKRIDTPAGLQIIYIPLHKQSLSPGDSVILGASGSGGGGGSASALYLDRLNLSFYRYVTPYIASEDKDTLTEPTSVVQYDPASKSFKFINIGDSFLTKQLLDVDFLSQGVGLDTIELYCQWDLAHIDTNAIYEISEDGGNNFETMTMTRIGQSDSFVGTLKLAHTGTDNIVNEYALLNSDGSVELDATNVKGISQQFTTTQTIWFRNLKFELTKTGTPQGYYSYKIVKDNLGSPSLDANDIVYISDKKPISSLSAGLNTINDPVSFILPAGSYHLIVEADGAYQASFVAGTTSIAVGLDTTTAPAPNYRSFNGTAYSAEVLNNKMVYQFNGRVLDLRVKITSSLADVRLKSFGIYYDNEQGIVNTSNIFRDIKQFSGASNQNIFTLNFLPDSRLLSVYSIETGQVYRYGAFTIDGHNVIFPADTFNSPSTPVITLEFIQVQGVDGQSSSTVADSLLTANHLGSTDPALDKSSNGKGILLRDANGQLVELYVDGNMQIKLRVV